MIDVKLSLSFLLAGSLGSAKVEGIKTIPLTRRWRNVRHCPGPSGLWLFPMCSHVKNKNTDLAVTPCWLCPDFPPEMVFYTSCLG